MEEFLRHIEEYLKTSKTENKAFRVRKNAQTKTRVFFSFRDTRRDYANYIEIVPSEIRERENKSETKAGGRKKKRQAGFTSQDF